MKQNSILNTRKKYLQIALNNTLSEAQKIILSLPASDRIIIEAGTPFIKRYGESGIRQIKEWHAQRLLPQPLVTNQFDREEVSEEQALRDLIDLGRDLFFGPMKEKNKIRENSKKEKIDFSYVVADLKTIDRGQTEVEIASRAGASAAIAMGQAPKETLDNFISACQYFGMDSMIDMMNVEFPLSVLRSLKKVPTVVILHRGVDEESDNRQKMLPLHEIRRIKGNYDLMISVAGGDTLREVQSSIFNDADIVVVWKSVFEQTKETIDLVNGFLKVVE